MRTTMDGSGRVVLPKRLRDQAGLVPGEIDIVMDGDGLHVRSVSSDQLVEEGGELFVDAAGTELTGDAVRELRLADQR